MKTRVHGFRTPATLLEYYENKKVCIENQCEQAKIDFDKIQDPEELKTNEEKEIVDIFLKLVPLTERELKIIKLYFGIDEKQESYLEEIAQKFNITLERARQIKETARSKLIHYRFLVEQVFKPKNENQIFCKASCKFLSICLDLNQPVLKRCTYKNVIDYSI